LATQSGTTTVPSGGTTDYTGSVDLEEGKSCPILIDAVFDVPCECKSNVFYFDEPPLPDFLDLDGPISLCPGDDLTLAVCGGYQFALNPSIGGTITNTGGVLTVDLADGFGISNPVILEVTTGHAQCPGSFELEIFQMETFEIGPFSQLDACDSECTVLDLNLPIWILSGHLLQVLMILLQMRQNFATRRLVPYILSLLPIQILDV